MSRVELQALLLSDGTGGHRHGLLQVPTDGRVHTLVLHAQALGSEQNLSRRQVVLTARAWAEAGAAVLILDLAGCGDSTGDDEAAEWARWADDLRRAADWLRLAWPGRPLWGWGLRGGALALAGSWPEGQGPDHWLLWQPLLDGDDLHRHWQRQIAAAALAEGRDGRAASTALTEAWARGETVDVAGAPVGARLAAGAHARSCARPPGPGFVGGPAAEGSPALGISLPTPGSGTPASPRRLVWIEVAATARAEPAPRVAAALQAWQAAGWRADWRHVEGPAFWLGPEVSTSPTLTEATLQAVRDDDPSAGRAQGDVAPIAQPMQAQAARTATAGCTPALPRGTQGFAEHPCTFEVDGARLLGIVALPESADGDREVQHQGDTGVLIVVGGPQTRVGARRRFVGLARALARAGFPTLRFDLRGMGDSEGEPPGFEASGPDITAAALALRAQCPGLRRVVLWGLCDGASAGVLAWREAEQALARHAAKTSAARYPLEPLQIAGLCLVNPWVRTPEVQASAQVAHYYGSRLRDPAFWRKLLRGGVGWAALAGWWQAWRRARAHRLSHVGGVQGAAVGAGEDDATARDFTDRMAHRLRAFDGPVAIVLSGQDHTAREFEVLAREGAAWQGLAARPTWTRIDHPEADHTHGGDAARAALEGDVLRWLQRHFGATAGTPPGPDGRRP